MNITRTTNSPEETAQLAREVADALKGKVILLSGDLGAGKTTFVKAVAEYFGSDLANSPTFAIAQRYEGVTETVYHFDLYRLETEFELENTGFYELLDEQGTKFVEWANKFALQDILENYAEIHITINGETSRTYSVTAA